MINMRIDIIRKELERVYDRIKQKTVGTSDEFEELAALFLHVLLSEPVTKGFVLGLSKFKEDALNSEDFKQTMVEINRSIKAIFDEIDKLNLADVEKMLHNFDNVFCLRDDDGRMKDNLTFNEFKKCLKGSEYRQTISNPMNLGCIISELDRIFKFIKDKKPSLDKRIINSSFDNLNEGKRRINSYLTLKAELDGATALLSLLPYYLSSEYVYLSGLTQEEYDVLARNASQDLQRYQISGTANSSYISKDCGELYHAVDKFLSTSKSKGFLIDRLITYCTIKVEDFPKKKSPKRGDNEKQISKIVGEFFFNHGYFPLVHFEMGRSIPDILSMPGMEDARWDNSILAELKQTIGEPYTESKLAKHIGQAKQYLIGVRGVKQDILLDTVYLLIFYDGKNPLDIEQSFREDCEKDNVNVKFIYIGKETPSTLGAPKILGAPKKVVKKK